MEISGLRGWDRVRKQTTELAKSMGFPGLTRRSTLNAAVRLEMLIKEGVPLNKNERWMAGMTFKERLNTWRIKEHWKIELMGIQKRERETGQKIVIAGHERWRGPKPRKTKAQYQKERWAREEER